MRLIGRKVICFYTDAANRIYKFEGTVLEISDGMLQLDDIKGSVICLPLSSCRIEVQKEEQDG